MTSMFGDVTGLTACEWITDAERWCAVADLRIRGMSFSTSGSTGRPKPTWRSRMAGIENHGVCGIVSELRS